MIIGMHVEVENKYATDTNMGHFKNRLTFFEYNKVLRVMLKMRADFT